MGNSSQFLFAEESLQFFSPTVAVYLKHTSFSFLNGLAQSFASPQSHAF
jgi:hypothetical protein